VVKAAAGRPVIEFGSRRAHGLEAARLAARAACLAGCQATSNVEAARCYGLPVAGTMAHSWVMAFEDEIEAFRAYEGLFGAQAVLLIDTYDAIVATQRLVQAGLTPAAVRIDSGDLLMLSRSVRAILDAGGLRATRIIVSGDLDEHRIAQLVSSLAPVDSFGVGTSISTVSDAPALGGVYKLVETEHHGHIRPTVKLSSGKRTLPGRKQVWRVSEQGYAPYDVIGLTDERQDGRPLLRCVMRDGQRVAPSPDFSTLQKNARQRIAELPASVTTLDAPAPLMVRISPALDALARSACHS
jgi:nicotinate phosphoribosyltransferase